MVVAVTSLGLGEAGGTFRVQMEFKHTCPCRMEPAELAYLSLHLSLGLSSASNCVSLCRW